MSDTPQMPQPTKEHHLLLNHVGNWRVECTYFMDPSHPPFEVVASETIEMVGHFWSQSRFKADMGEFVLEGSATMGFDPDKRKWVSTWIDNANPTLFHVEGDLDEDAGVLEMVGRGPSPVDEEETTYRTVEKAIDQNTRTLDMYVTLPTGDELQMFSYTYHRED